MSEAAVVWLLRDAQNVTHEGVEVNGVDGLFPIAFMKGGAMGCQEGVHTAEGVIIAMIAYCERKNRA